MTELEKLVVSDLIDFELIKFCYSTEAVAWRCFAKKEFLKFSKIHTKIPVTESLFYGKRYAVVSGNTVRGINAFDNNFKWTIDKIRNDIVHFLDIKINRNETGLYYTTTHLVKFIDFTNFMETKICMS